MWVRLASPADGGAGTISVATFMPAGKPAFQNIPAYLISHPRISNSGLKEQFLNVIWFQGIFCWQRGHRMASVVGSWVEQMQSFWVGYFIIHSAKFLLWHPSSWPITLSCPHPGSSLPCLWQDLTLSPPLDNVLFGWAKKSRIPRDYLERGN